MYSKLGTVVMYKHPWDRAKPQYKYKRLSNNYIRTIHNNTINQMEAVNITISLNVKWPAQLILFWSAIPTNTRCTTNQPKYSCVLYKGSLWWRTWQVNSLQSTKRLVPILLCCTNIMLSIIIILPYKTLETGIIIIRAPLELFFEKAGRHFRKWSMSTPTVNEVVTSILCWRKKGPFWPPISPDH